MTENQKRVLENRTVAGEYLAPRVGAASPLSTKVAFVAMFRPIPLGIAVKSRVDLDIEFGYSLGDAIAVAANDLRDDPKTVIDEILAEFAKRREELEREHQALIHHLQSPA